MYCPKCHKTYSAGNKWCMDCEDENDMPIRLVEESQSGLNFTGSGNVIDQHHTEQHIKNENDNSQNSHNDSHNDNSTHYDNRGQVNVSGNYQVNQVAAQTTEVDVKQQHEKAYLAACRRVYEDFVIDPDESRYLDGLAQEYHIAPERAIEILNGVKAQMDAERDEADTLTYRESKRLHRIVEMVRGNDDVDEILDQAELFEDTVRENSNPDLHFVYFLVQAALDHKKGINIYETTSNTYDSYWKSFWSYVAYLKDGNRKVAERIGDKLEKKFKTCPSVRHDVALLDVVGESILGNNKMASKDLVHVDETKLSPRLQRLFDALLIMLDPEEAKENELQPQDYDFYFQHIFNYETEAERQKKAEEEARLKKEAEERTKAEAERLRKEEEERQRIAAEEEKRRQEEEERLRKEEERRRKEEEARKAKETADAEARMAKEVADAEARKHVTYEVIVSGVRDKGKAEKNLADIMGWRSGDCRKKLSRTPFAVKSFRDDKESAIDLCFKLSTNGMMSIIKGKNGLNEVIDCSDILAQVQNLVFEENERKRREEEERQAEIRRQKELEAQRKAEAKAAADAEARKHVTYSVKVSGVNDRSLAEKNLATITGWSSSNCRKQLSRLPFTAKSFNETDAAIELCVKLCINGMTGIITAKNGLNESVDCSDLMSQAQVKTYYELDRLRKEEEERQEALRIQREREEAERKKQAELEAEAKRRAEEQIRAYFEVEQRKKEEAERLAALRLQQEREAKRRAEAEERARLEEEFRKKQQAKEEARRREEARRKAEAEKKKVVEAKQNAKANFYNGHEYVDLGLPSGTLWATCNMGASKPEENGHYFAWGETKGYDLVKEYDGYKFYIQKKYLFSSKWIFTKYCHDKKEGIVDNLNELELCDDAATQQWGGNWRIPTSDQFRELYDSRNTDCKLSSYGLTVCSKRNMNSLFFPFAGKYIVDNDVHDNPSLIHYASLIHCNVVIGKGWYWSRTKLDSDVQAVAFTFVKHPGDLYDIDNYKAERWDYLPIRPICKK